MSAKEFADDKYHPPSSPTVSCEEQPREDTRWKGVLYIVLNGLVISVGFLFAKILFERNPSLSPMRMLFLRSILATLIAFASVHKNLKAVLIDDVSRD